jgi:acyl-homoserine lactone acylase PvdQ
MRKPRVAIAITAASLTLFLIAGIQTQGQSSASADLARWEQQAKAVTIVRDDWGIAHVHGKTDADAVFGMIYAQAEDDFNRVETNFINGIGRLAEAEGESKIWQDLRMKIFIDPVVIKAQYDASPAFLKALMNAWADGLNFYLAKHPQVKPRVITRFEPWMALTFSEGSIGGDIEKVSLGQLQAFYGGSPATSNPVNPVNLLNPMNPLDADEFPPEPGGSNGAAVAPANTTAHHALLLINPHTSELQVTSDEGLNAYGAATWGQFFIYQGFNDRTGWMHTTSAVDDIDEYLETVEKKGDGYVYKYGAEDRPVTSRVIKVPYKTDKGMAEKSFTVYRTQHGPIVRAMNGKWVAVAMMQEPLKALTQSYMRTKSKNYKEFAQTMEQHTNSSNNTIFADAEGNIAYFHANFIPKRDPKFDWTRPVDGSDPATDWKGLLSLKETPNLLNPASGWLYNSNNSPWSAAGPSSPKKADYPVYVDSGVESSRGLHAIRVLQNKKDFTLDGLIAAAYDSYQPWFEKPIPQLIKAWDAAAATNPLKAKLAEQIAMLRAWDLRWSPASIPTSLAVFWGSEIQRTAGGRRGGGSGQAAPVDDPLVNATPDQLLQALSTASDKLAADFGSWKTPWGDINRFQRLTDDLVHPFSDAGPSIPVSFTTATWGSLASFAARTYNGSKKIYGTSGNSFVAVVEFGPTVRAKAVTAGGESGDPKSPHFNDQAKRYSTGDLREVYFYPAQLKAHTEREYHPGG